MRLPFVLKVVPATLVVCLSLSESAHSQDQTGMSLGPIQPPAEIGQETTCVVFIGQIDCSAGEELSCGSDFPEPEATDEPVYPIEDGPLPTPNPFDECDREDVGMACLNTPMWRIDGEDGGVYDNYTELGTPHENQGVTALASPVELVCWSEGDCVCSYGYFGAENYNHGSGLWEPIETTACVTTGQFDVTGYYYVPNTDDVCDLNYIVDPFDPVDPEDSDSPEDPLGPGDDGAGDPTDGPDDPNDGGGTPPTGGGSPNESGGPNQSEMEAQQAESEAQMAAEYAAYEAQMAAEQAAYEAQMVAEQAAYDAAMAAEQAAYEAAMAAEQAAYEAAMAAQQQYGP